jgi:hypothetical protein
MRILIGAVFFPFSCTRQKNMPTRGGDSKGSSVNRNTGYSTKAQCTGKPAYLEPNRDSLQKPIGGLSVTLLPELYKGTINKGAIVTEEHQRRNEKPLFEAKECQA